MYAEGLQRICEAATELSSNIGKQLLQPLQTPQTMQQQTPQTMQQQTPQTMQQYAQKESQQQGTTQQIMEILNKVPEAQRQGILSKVDESQLPKLIHASFPLAMTVVDVAPGSKVVKEITERPELHAVLNSHEKQVFLSLNTDPTPEKLAEFLDLPPEKLPEFLNMLTKDELSEMFDMLPQHTLTSVLTSLSVTRKAELKPILGVHQYPQFKRK
jgi:flagellar motor switch protein FliG